MGDTDNEGNQDRQPELDGLTETQIEQVQRFIARQIADSRQPAPVVQVRQINTTIDIPQYDAQKTNTKTYYTNLKKYFKAQGYDEDNYHNYLGGVLKGEFKLWYDAHSHEIDSWKDFEKSFSQKYDSDEIERNRCKSFYSWKQRLIDPCEQFVYEMVALGKQVLPTPYLHMDVLLATVRDALHPEIGLAIADQDLNSIDDFMNRIAIVHNNLTRQSRLNKGKQIEIPPLKGNRDDLLKQQRQNNQSNRNDHSRGRSQFRSSFHGSRGYNNNQHKKNYESNSSNQSHERNRDRYSSNRNSDSNHSRDGNGANHRNSSNSNRDRNQQQNNSNPRSDNGRGRGRGREYPDIKCHKCSRFGHIARNCTELSVAMSMYGTQIPQANPFVLTNPQPNPFMQQSQPNPAQQQQISSTPNPLSQYTTSSSNNSNPQSDTLNFLGRTFESSNRGFSQH